jgi:glutathione peroxidase
MNPVQYFLESLGFLEWCVLAAVLALADVFLPRARLLGFAVAAGVIGFALLLFPLIRWPWQLACFGVLAAAGWDAYRFFRRSPSTAPARSTRMSSFHDFTVKTIDGSPKALKDYRGKPVLVVNVASACGLTPQYTGLEKLFREFAAKGLVVLGLPCNQFGAQEPGSEVEIKQFCSLNYDVSFPLTSKVEVNGPGAHPLYAWLRGETGGADIQWNFEKFLIGKDGKVAGRFDPGVKPEDPKLVAAIEAELKK